MIGTPEERTSRSYAKEPAKATFSYRLVGEFQGYLGIQLSRLSARLGCFRHKCPFIIVCFLLVVSPEKESMEALRNSFSFGFMIFTRVTCLLVTIMIIVVIVIVIMILIIIMVEALMFCYHGYDN